MELMLTRASRLGVGILAASLGASILQASPAWNPKAAAAYLDQRQSWWMAWPPATRDNGTFCVSCHTVAPYALARPALRAVLDEKAPSENERKLLESVVKRVHLWNQIAPYYPESIGANKPLQSRGTEAVLDALILAAADARTGKLSDDTQAAFDHMWATQAKTGDQKGAWPWLDFGNEPFEAVDSVFYGASLAAVAVATAPENYRARSGIRENLKALSDYIGREYRSQSLIHQVVSLWAATKWPELLSHARQKSIIDDVFKKQKSDGGWGLSSTGWTWTGSNLRTVFDLWVRSNDSPWSGKSDGYATGLVVFVLGQAGIPFDDPHLQRGRSWLVRNQNPKEGMWPGFSMVNGRDATSGTGRFMTDAATAYAVLALTANPGQLISTSRPLRTVTRGDTRSQKQGRTTDGPR
jgi:squalene-hopene/tetraprenyl-beta-curcumene cyclase